MLLFFLILLLYDVKIISAAFVDIFSISNILDTSNIVPLLTVAGSIFAYFSVVVVNYGDFTRYIKDKN